MALLGVESVVYATKDLDLCRRFFRDFGLQLEGDDEGGVRFGLPEGSTILLRRADAPDLPSPFQEGPGPREIVWGVDSAEALSAIAAELSRDRDVAVGADGALHTRDDAGLNIGFRVWRRLALEQAPAPPENGPSHVARWDCNRRWYERAQPKTINHVVFGTPDVDRAAAFYIDRLGFRLTDIMRGVGMFLRCDGRHEHHNLFFRRRRTLRFDHLSFDVDNIDELMVGARLMCERGWTTRQALGRHRMGSLLFYYLECPAGGQAEYTADGDHVTDAWKPRLWDVEFGNHYWLADGGETSRIALTGRPEEILGERPSLADTLPEAAE